MVDLRDYLSRDFWRTHALEAGYAGAGVVFFALFLVATFPYSDAVSNVLAPMGLGLKSGDQKLSLPFGVELEDVRLVSLTAPGAPLLQSDRIKVAPALGSLLLLHPGVRARADLYDGIVSVSARRSGGGTQISFDLSSLNLARNRELASLGANLAGLLSGSGTMLLAADDPASQSGDLGLTATGVNLRVGTGMPAITLGNVNARLKLAGGALSLEQFRSSGGELTLDGQGTIRPASDWRQSPINLTVKMAFSPGAQSRLQFLLAMLPHLPGDEPYRILGTLGAPIFVGAPSAAPLQSATTGLPSGKTGRLARLRQAMGPRKFGGAVPRAINKVPMNNRAAGVRAQSDDEEDSDSDQGMQSDDGDDSPDKDAGADNDD